MHLQARSSLAVRTRTARRILPPRLRLTKVVEVCSPESIKVIIPATKSHGCHTYSIGPRKSR